MTSHLWCAPHVHLATIDEDVIVLDLQEDHYDCLVDAAVWLKAGDDGSILVRDRAAANALRETGIAIDDPPPSRRGPCVRPSRDFSVPTGSQGMEILRALVGMMTATAVFQNKSLLELVGHDRSPSLTGFRPTGHDALPGSDIATFLAAARRARPWIPFEGECLQRAFQLRYYLALRGIATDWVFGVRTWPFSAHCWLQIGDVVIGDRLERVARYTPIMTV